ncbi:MAG: 30S ribosomal protein S17 [Candidatus Woesearchaeota archaeon]|nr:30S ribosomal protein S17 [Candidatus Woesearchaeota archaeon]
MECNDHKCSVHGSVRSRGRSFVGQVIQTKAQQTATVQWERRKFVAKYERYEKRRTTVAAHNPACINAHDGDTVRIMECRPLSKTKRFAIIEKITQTTKNNQASNLDVSKHNSTSQTEKIGVK